MQFEREISPFESSISVAKNIDDKIQDTSSCLTVCPRICLRKWHVHLLRRFICRRRWWCRRFLRCFVVWIRHFFFSFSLNVFVVDICSVFKRLICIFDSFDCLHLIITFASRLNYFCLLLSLKKLLLFIP